MASTNGRHRGSATRERRRSEEQRQRRGNGAAGAHAERGSHDGTEAQERLKEKGEEKRAKREESGGLGGWVAKRAGQWRLEDFDPRIQRIQRYVTNLVADHYFRMEVHGWHRLPDPPAMLVGIHSGGILPWDAWFLGFEWHRRFGEERIVHGTAHDALMAAPGVGEFFRKMGVVPASPEAVATALEEGRDVVIYPGGDVDAMRPWRERDQVKLAGRSGFVKQAIAAGVPIVPVASIGGTDTMIVLTEGRGLARRLGLTKLARAEVLPIGLGVPWGIAPALIPFFPMPAKIRTEILEPVWVDDDPDRVEDDDYIQEVYEEVESRLQEGVDYLASRRSIPIMG
jgi:1-acyl-sn-glycerol-3-phosphate acyltransferase